MWLFLLGFFKKSIYIYMGTPRGRCMLFRTNPWSCSNKTLAIRPLTSHLKSHQRKLRKTCWALPVKKARTHKRRSPSARRHMSATSKSLHSSTLWGNLVPSRRFIICNRQWYRTAKENQRKSCYLHALLIHTHIYIYIEREREGESRP